jgi:hypothetical protein
MKYECKCHTCLSCQNIRFLSSLSQKNNHITIVPTVLQQWVAQYISLRKVQKMRTPEIKLLGSFELNTGNKHGSDNSDNR